MTSASPRGPGLRGPGAKPGGRTVFFAFYHLAQDELRKWEMLTCLHFGVVHPVSDLFLTDQVIYNLHSYRRFWVSPLQDHKSAAGLVSRGQSQPECRQEEAWNRDPAEAHARLLIPPLAPFAFVTQRTLLSHLFLNQPLQWSIWGPLSLESNGFWRALKSFFLFI